MPMSYQDRIERVLAHIRLNLAGDLSLDCLADIAALSRFHFHRTFVAMTGETVAEAVRRARLNRGAQLLSATTRPLPDIAAEVGYPNTDSFTRAFREAFGKPPSEIRAGTIMQRPLLPQRKGLLPMHDVSIQTLPAQRILALPHRGPYVEIGATFRALWVKASNSGLVSHINGPAVALFYDDPQETPAQDLRGHAGLSVDADAPVPDGFDDLLRPAGRHAVLHLKGPYTGIPAAWSWLYGTWLPQSGEVPADSAPFELYPNGPDDTPPAELITKICVPLREQGHP